MFLQPHVLYLRHRTEFGQPGLYKEVSEVSHWDLSPVAEATRCPQGKETALKDLAGAFFPIPNCNFFHLQLPKVPQSGKSSPQSPPKFLEDLLLSVTKRDSLCDKKGQPWSCCCVPEGVFVMHFGRQLAFYFWLGLGDIKLQTDSEEQPTAQPPESLFLRAPVGISGFFHPEHSVICSSTLRPMINTRQD